ncbi:hypothetical protein L6452_39766 [Arctium lappa]|uniref:Uncharacterized protein n=1 Tax=Arctium lappa TaxID=4217 RepID=A0ACB8XSJ6_ARCLA|nr:hypothetical protein L6452_39766 [Arctium lappa]
MEAPPFHHRHHHHSFLSDQSLSFPNSTATNFSDDQLITIEMINAHSNQDSIDNKLQSSDSSVSMAVHDHQHKVEKTKMPTTNSTSFNYLQSNETNTCRRGRKEKRSNNDKENNKKKMIDSKEEGQIGYIHVRARRGEATDSHSLAERVLSSKLASVSPMSLHEFGADFDAFMFKSHQEMPSFQENQMASMVSQNNGEILWNLEEQRQELDDPFAIINTFDSFY